jgi:hypothetical protein
LCIFPAANETSALENREGDDEEGFGPVDILKISTVSDFKEENKNSK